jgi:hypothetical protein
VVLLGRWNWWPARLSRQPADQPGDPSPENSELNSGHAGQGAGQISP